ncbi:MAG: hypothetical protein GX062_09510 [Firmicutes bacterium]|jgi:hypothetical protein|nr:hypothetical protein [Bacillota bacterium]
MEAPRGLGIVEKYILLPISVILMGAATWNWAHGWRDTYGLIWFLIGLNNLFSLGRKGLPRHRRLFDVLVPLSGTILIFLSAYLLFTYWRP